MNNNNAKKNVVCAEWICMELKEGTGPFPFDGEIGDITLGGLTPRDMFSSHAFMHRVNGNPFHLEFYVPNLPGKLSGNRLLMTLVVNAVDKTYTFTKHGEVQYARVALRVEHKSPVPDPLGGI